MPLLSSLSGSGVIILMLGKCAEREHFVHISGGGLVSSFLLCILVERRMDGLDPTEKCFAVYSEKHLISANAH